MTTLIAFPFSLNKSGHVVTLPDDSDAYYAGEIASLALTHIGERELVPDYGITDPSFYEFNEVEFIGQVALFGPPVKIKTIEQDFVSSIEREIEVEFDSVIAFDDEEFVDTDTDEQFFEEGF